jgi:hypothetical protein
VSAFPPPTGKPVDIREPQCILNWEDCRDGRFDPRCCRFPKSCSCTAQHWYTHGDGLPG